MKILPELLNKIGIHSESWISFINVVVIIILLGLLGWGTYILVKKVISKIVMRFARKTSNNWDNIFFDQKFFNRLGLFLVPVVITVAMTEANWEAPATVIKLISAWVVFAAIMMISAVLDGVNRIYATYPVSRDRPIKMIMQVVMIFLWGAGVMVCIHIFTGTSLTALLGGLTAFAAVLMLIFQDSILGFVAGIQLSANNMVRIGDWIVMPSRGVDGDVIEINLTTVKVQNWDKTITTIPTHKLVSESFTNWRGMEESKGRRIKRSVNIDVSSIHYLSEKEITTLKESTLLKNYMEAKIKEIEDYNRDRSNMFDERRMTNIGTFREYLESWISLNPNINTEMTHMVRQLQPGPTGVPLEVYCFSALQQWVQYEQVQADIFDHIYAVMPLFDLRAFQYGGNVAAAETPQQ